MSIRLKRELDELKEVVRKLRDDVEKIEAKVEKPAPVKKKKTLWQS